MEHDILSNFNFFGLFCFIASIVHSVLGDVLLRSILPFYNKKSFRRLLFYASEVEFVFIFWALIYCFKLALFKDFSVFNPFPGYIYDICPLFFIGIIASSHYIPFLFNLLIQQTSKFFFISRIYSEIFLLLTLGCWMASALGEVAAIILVAQMLIPRCFKTIASQKIKYELLAILFLNISIGGALSKFAAPPIVIMAQKFHWSTSDVFNIFKYKVFIATVLVTFVFLIKNKKTIDSIVLKEREVFFTFKNFLYSIVPVLFLLFLVFVSHSLKYVCLVFGVYALYVFLTNQNISFKTVSENLKVCCFIFALMVLGSAQRDWLNVLLENLPGYQMFFIAMLFSGFMDNAALVTLLVQLHSRDPLLHIQALSGSLTAGGLTLMANAANPIAWTILKKYFLDQQFVLREFIVATLPWTIIAALVFFFVNF